MPVASFTACVLAGVQIGSMVNRASSLADHPHHHPPHLDVADFTCYFDPLRFMTTCPIKLY